MKTHINRGEKGWTGQTDIPTTSAVLRIISERAGLSLTTYLTRHRLTPHGRLAPAVGEAMVLARSYPLAVTESVLRHQHEAAVQDVESKLLEMALHYGARA